MNGHSSRSITGLLTRSLLPSTTSVSFSIVVAIIVVLLGLLFWSVNYGTILPYFFGGELATLYTNVVVQPIDTLIHTTVWDGGITIVVYSLCGALIYQLVTMAVHTYRGWWRSRHYVQFDARYTIMNSHLDRPFLFRLVWRLGVSIIAIAFLVLTAPLMHRAVADIQLAVVAVNPADIARKLAFVFLVTLLLLHCWIVLLRLYTMRTRLFGDDRVYEGESKQQG